MRNLRHYYRLASWELLTLVLVAVDGGVFLSVPRNGHVMVCGENSNQLVAAGSLDLRDAQGGSNNRMCITPLLLSSGEPKKDARLSGQNVLAKTCQNPHETEAVGALKGRRSIGT